MAQSSAHGDVLKELFGVAGKVVVVTGAAVGFGRGSCALLASLGATIVGIDRDAERLSKVIDAAKAAGGKAEAIVADVTDEAAVVKAFEQIGKMHGRIDILINANTAVGSTPLIETSVAEWRRHHDNNLFATFLCCREGVKQMLAAKENGQGSGGRIVIFTTIGSMHPVLHGNEAYSSSKAGANMIARNIAMDYAKDGITANCILPGAVRTEDTDQMKIMPSGPGARAERHPMGGITVEQVVPLLLPFVGPSGQFVTGQMLAVDGGYQIA